MLNPPHTYSCQGGSISQAPELQVVAFAFAAAGAFAATDAFAACAVGEDAAAEHPSTSSESLRLISMQSVPHFI